MDNETPETKKVKLELEIDTKLNDISTNPYSRWVHFAYAVDAWRIFPRVFITSYMVLLHKTVDWFMRLPDPNAEQSALISVVVGAGAAWFGLYVKSRGDAD